MIKWLVDTWSLKKPEEAVVSTTLPQSHGVQLARKSIQQIPNTSTFEAQIFHSVNAHRNSLGMQALQGVTQLNEIALSHTQAMLATNTRSHNNWNERGRQIQSLGFGNCGKNVGGGECYPHEVSGMINILAPGWLNSTGHRQVIETAAFTHTGIALLIGQHPSKLDRTIWFVTQVFARHKWQAEKS